MGATPTYALRYPELTDPADVPTDMHELASDVEAALALVAGRLPGAELAYAQFTATVNITATAEGSADAIVAAAAITLDGTTAIIVEFFCPIVAPPATAGQNTRAILRDGGTSLTNVFGQVGTPAAATTSAPMLLRRKLTPSAGSHTFSIAGYSSGSGGSFFAGPGGAGQIIPGYIRITRA